MILVLRQRNMSRQMRIPDDADNYCFNLEIRKYVGTYQTNILVSNA